MPYKQQGDITELFKPVEARAMAAHIAAEGGDRLHENVARNTPVKSGNLRTSWYKSPPVGAKRRPGGGAWAYEVRVATDVEYGGYVEDGTGMWGPKKSPYEIHAKRGTYMSWRDPRTGAWVSKTMVTHPGSRGAHMMAIAAALTEHQIDEIAQPLLTAWARRLESAASV